MSADSNSADGVPPAPKAKRRAKKTAGRKTKKAKSTVEPAAGLSENVTTMSATPAIGMPEMGIVHVAAAVSDHPKSPESATTKQDSAVAPQQPLQSEPPSGLAASTEGMPAVENHVLFGL